ncbi:protein kinase domain-containing protein [Cellulosimicrobium composti]|uniref:Protein kinase n=1 Tax=Cellulosimicrobium composti TaxID=2672572 RepID=A0A6N7ZDI1_9MICO|nr:serine/threonine-protein kinase [Cellulosimicrobium composti]MTG87494.1 protein kinase [Cellulosimicrobium composti]NDO88017.1 serine/threonine protein kinase [Cellulosimicrobium composti]TWG85381.1 protein kinase-like protein [Cellulosimicrobium cellulans J34]SMF24472.1 Protein kinase domain-containing protein [Cellulosimicrobium cellulans J1]
MEEPTQRVDARTVPGGTSRGPAPGSEVGGYLIGARLGSGAMGTVHSAHDGGGNLVAIKLLHAHLDLDTAAQGRERLRREALALQRLRHPAVAQILDVELDGPDAFIVTELVDGPTLEDEIAEGGPLDPWDLYELADQLAAALEAVHAAGVVHRDLKPSNVMVSSRGPVLIDFGIAQGLEDARVTSTGLVMGTPGYLAPELLEGAAPSVDTDWWGWAALLAYAATGRAPFGVRPTDVVLARARSGRPDLAGLGPVTAGALAGALHADPARRLGPTEVVAALRHAADSGDAAPPTQLVSPPTGPTQVVPPAAVVPAGWTGQAAVVPPPLPTSQSQVNDGRTTAVPVDPDLMDELGAPPLGDDGEPLYVRPVPPARRTALLLLAAPLVLLGAMYPGVAFVVLSVLVVLARVVGVTTESLHARRERRGVSPRDTARAVAASPWYVVRALVGALPSLLVAACAGVLVVVAGWWLLESDRWVVAAGADGGNSPVVTTVVLCVAALAAVVLAWAGPLTYLTRYGTRTALARLAPGRTGTLVLAGVGLVLTVVCVVLLAGGPEVAWWPFPGPPSLR